MKFKLYRVGGRSLLNPQQLGQSLLQDRYDEQKEVGFSIVQISDLLIRGSFLEKRRRRVRVFDALGETRVVEIDSVSILKFEIHPKAGFLIVFDTHAVGGAFISRLGLLSGFCITIETAVIPILQVVEFLHGNGYSVEAIEISGVNISVAPEIDGSVRLRGKLDLGIATSGRFFGKKGDIVNAKLLCRSDDESFVFGWKGTSNYEVEPSPKRSESFLCSLMKFSDMQQS